LVSWVIFRAGMVVSKFAIAMQVLVKGETLMGMGWIV